MIGEPPVRAERQPPREQPRVLGRDAHGRAEQRMMRRPETERARVAATARRLEPVAPALERVRRQVHVLPALEERAPVDIDARRVRLRQEAHDRLGLGPAAPHRGGGEGALQRLLGERREDAVRAELEEAGDPGGLEEPDPVHEAHALARLPHPVLRRVHIGGLAGEIRDDRDPRRVERQALRDAAVVVEHRVDPLRVERVAHLQPRRLPLDALEPLVERAGVAGHDRRARRVHGRDRQPLRQARAHLLLRGAHGGHRAALGKRAHQPAARRHQLARVLERQHSRHVRRHDLAHGMPDEEVRLQAPRLDEPEQGDLDGEQRRLRHLRVVERLVAEHALADVEVLAHGVERLAEHRERLVQLTSHPGPLRALPREHERRGARPDLPLHDPVADHRRPVLELRAPNGEREGDV